MVLFALVAFLFAAPTAEAAEPFETSGNVRWVVFASRQNSDEAIGLARRYGNEFGPVQVLSTSNGWYAIAAGPLPVSDPSGLKKALSTSWWVPKDTFLSKGRTFLERVWQSPRSPVLATASTEDGKPRIAADEGVEARIVIEGSGKSVLASASGKAMKIPLDDGDSFNTSVSLSLARLDPSSPFPQIVIRYFTGGAHCCTDMKIATFLDGRWRLVQVGQFDIDGPAIEDLNSDGVARLVGKGDAFDYAFAAYSLSCAPPKILRLEGARIVDVSKSPKFQRPLRQMLLAAESESPPEQWKSNGFLGGWVALKILIGDGAEAWTRMLALYDRNSDWDLNVCTVETKLGEQCPANALLRRDFPTAPRELLVSRGHGAPAATANPARSSAPSFDCKKARTATERRICNSPRLAELDNILAAGYGFIKTTKGRPAADAIGIPFWRITGQCEGDTDCIARHQVEEISAFGLAGAPVSLPAWAAPAPPAPVPAPTVAPVVAKSEAPQPSPSANEVRSCGTGFFATPDGIVLTNAHVIEDCAEITVRTSSGDTAVARVQARDARNDLALLRTGLAPKKVAAFRTSIRQGEGVEAFGFPLTFVLATSGNFTLGNVSALAGIGDDSRYLQISAPVQPGNSGGGLLDQAGNVVGVVSAKINALKMMLATNGDIPQNVNFAIKASIVENFMDSNGVAYSAGTATQTMQPADVADLARAMSAFVECR